MTGEKLLSSNSEQEREIYTPNFACLTISGLSGTGKTEAGILLAHTLGVPDEQFVRTGILFRQQSEKETGKPFMGYQERSLEFDRKIDKRQKELIQNATIAKPIILEGKLAGVIGNEVDSERQNIPNMPPVIRILFVAPDKVRLGRVIQRELEKHPEKSPEEIRQKTIERDAGDLKHWRELHPSLKDLDPFNPVKSNGIYNLIVDTTPSIKVVVQTIFNHLKKNNLIVKY
jgi:cytidylate kinase